LDWVKAAAVAARSFLAVKPSRKIGLITMESVISKGALKTFLHEN